MSDENLFLIYAVYAGIYITFLYDLIRIFRRIFVHGNLLVAAEDVVFWIYCGTKIFLLMYRFGNGMLRWYAVFGALAGMLVYKKTISRLFVKYTTMLFLKIKELIKKIICFFMRPLIKMMFFLKKKLTLLLKLLKMSL